MLGIAALRELYIHMEWADSHVWRAIGRLAEQDERLQAKLYHVHFTQRAFLSVWTGAKVPRYDPTSLPTYGQLRAWTEPFYGEANAYLATLADADLSRTLNVPWARLFEKAVGRPPGDTTLGQTIFQAANHTTYHRGQVNTRIRELGGEPPPVDYILWLWTGRPAPEWT